MNDRIMSSLSKIYQVVTQRTILMKENMILQQTGVDTWIHNLEYVAPITSMFDNKFTSKILINVWVDFTTEYIDVI